MNWHGDMWSSEAYEAVQWMFGFTKKEAKAFLEDADPNVVAEIVKGFRQQVKLIFAND